MRWLILALLSILIVSASRAETLAESVPNVSFAPFPRQLVRIHLYNYEGVPATKAEMNGPAPNDFPPHLIIGFEDGQEASKPGRYYFPSRNYLRVFNVIGVKTAPYQTIQAQIEHLEALLKERPARIPRGGKQIIGYGKFEQLPDYPPRNAGHVLQVKIDYLDGPWGIGLFYVTELTQDSDGWPNNDELVYIFQGLSKDRRYFVSADFHITHAKAPAGIDDIPQAIKTGTREEANQFVEKAIAMLASEPDDSFTPSLAAIRRWITTLKLPE